MKTRLWGLDLVRAIAIVFVLLAHGFQALLGLGFWGVEIFFALSGYLIGGILLDELASTGGGMWSIKDLFRFWLRRWFRTLPNYYFYLILYVLAVVLCGGSLSEDGPGWRYLVFAQNLLPGFEAGFFGVSWSLSVEEWFYLTFPALICFMQSTFRFSARHAFFLSAVALCVIPICLRFINRGEADLHGWDAGVRKIVVFRLDAIMWGVLAAFFKRAKLINWPLALAGLVLLVSGVFCSVANAESRFTWPGLLMLTLVPMGTALLLPSLERLDLPGWSGWGVTYISKISYSLYLCHALVIGIVVALPIYSSGGWQVKLGLKMVQYLVIFIIATATYQWLEKPCLKLRDRLTLS